MEVKASTLPPPPPPSPPSTPTPPLSPQSNFNSQLLVMNSPPIFEGGPLAPLIIKPGDNFNYTLPAVIDINNDTASISLELADCIPFATFNATNQTISFKPSISNAREAPYYITIILYDNVTTKGTTYYLKVYIKVAQNT